MAATEAGSPATEKATRTLTLRARLVSPLPHDRVWGWAGPLLVTAFGAFLRFYNLALPHAVVFDETYYAKDAFSILTFGVEHNYVRPGTNYANTLMLHGDPHIFAGGGEFVVMPPLGKILIAWGEWMFGLNPFGWRFASAVFGSLAILLIARIARRMTRSTMLGCAAGLLMSLDGLEFVESRFALLDIFLMFFVLAAFGCLVVDRDVSRARLADAVTAGGAAARDGAGPGLGVRWWLVAAGVFLGAACAVKWDGIWYIFGFAGLAIAWDIGARRAAGIRAFRAGGFLRDGKWLLLTFAVIPAAVYIATWTGWFRSPIGYDRHYAATQGVHIPVISALYSLYYYHLQMLHFDVTLDVSHPYMSQPWQWLVLARPIAYYYECYTSPAATHICPKGYTGPEWSQEILAIGTPAIWWAAVLALIFCVFWWLTRRDWRAGAVLLAVGTGWLPWFAFPARTKFFYYALDFEPFLILAIVLCLGLIIGSARASVVRRSAGAAVAGAYLLVVLANFAYLYPILAAKVIPYTSWLARMWFHSWILRPAIPALRPGELRVISVTMSTNASVPCVYIGWKQQRARSHHEPERRDRVQPRAVRARCHPAARPALPGCAQDDA